MSRVRVLESRIAGAPTGPSYMEVLLDVASRKPPSRDLEQPGAGELPQAALLRQVASWLERPAESGFGGSLARRAGVILVPHQGHSLLVEAKAYPPDPVRWRDVWEQWTTEQARSYFDRVQEFVGRVREVDREADTFTAVLGGRVADPDTEVVGTFDRRLVGDRAFSQLQLGTTFTLVTGYQIHLDPEGNAETGSLATRVILHRPRPRTNERRDAAITEANDLLED